MESLVEVHQKLAELSERAHKAHDPELDRKIDELLLQCPDLECLDCGRAVCPGSEPLHFHHDGCPFCWRTGEGVC